MKKLAVTILLLSTASFSNFSLAASFDCNKASRLQDKMICTNVELSKADSQLAAIYKTALQNTNDKEALKKAQLTWLKNRDICKDDSCMLQAYQTRITELQQNKIQGSAIKNNNASKNPEGKYPVWISPDLGVKSLSGQDINVALARKFWDSPIYQQEFKDQLEYLKSNYQDQGLPTNCLDIIQLIKAGKYDSDGTVGTRLDDKDVINLYNKNYSPLINRVETDCQAIRLLKQVKPAVKSAVNDFQFNEKIADVMPALAVPNSFVCITDPRLDDDNDDHTNSLWYSHNQKQSWSQFYKFNRVRDMHQWGDQFKFLHVDPVHLKLEFWDPEGPPYGSTTMQLLMRGDFNGNGQEAVLMGIQFHRNNIQGPIDEEIFSALLLLTRHKPTDVLEVLYPNNYMFMLKRNPECDGKLFSLTDEIK